MSIRIRTWTTRKGVVKTAPVLDYTDQHGKRHIETFARERDAKNREITVRSDVRAGKHTAHNDSVTVAGAAATWFAGCSDLEKATTDEYARINRRHIVPYLGDTKLSKLTAPMVRDYRDKLRDGGYGKARSAAMTRKILGQLGCIVADALEAGDVAQNVVRSINTRKRSKSKATQQRKLKVGVDIPTVDQIRAIIANLSGHYRALLLTAVFTGLRSSELRGLRWADIDFGKGEVHVTQRADRFLTLDAPKSESGERTVPIGKHVINTLKTWKWTCPDGPLGLAFPDEDGGVAKYADIRYAFCLMQVKAGVVDACGSSGTGTARSRSSA